MPIDGFGTVIGEAEDDDAWLVEDAGARISPKSSRMSERRAGALNELRIRGALQSQRSDVNGLVTQLFQELDNLGRDASICQKPHGSGAQRVQFVPCESSGVGHRLTHVFLFEIRQILDDLRRRHPIGNESDDVGDGDTKAG